MRRDADNVKQLAFKLVFRQRPMMKSPALQTKEDRLALALRANLRRRKEAARSEPAAAFTQTSKTKLNSPK